MMISTNGDKKETLYLTLQLLMRYLVKVVVQLFVFTVGHCYGCLVKCVRMMRETHGEM